MLSVLEELHWLPIVERIDFKVLVLTFIAMHGTGPFLPKSTFTSIQAPKINTLLTIPKYNLKSYDFRAFCIYSPILWNKLPEDITVIVIFSMYNFYGCNLMISPCLRWRRYCEVLLDNF